jgi:hypothetical protein
MIVHIIENYNYGEILNEASKKSEYKIPPEQTILMLKELSKENYKLVKNKDMYNMDFVMSNKLNDPIYYINRWCSTFTKSMPFSIEFEM